MTVAKLGVSKLSEMTRVSWESELVTSNFAGVTAHNTYQKRTYYTYVAAMK